MQSSNAMTFVVAGLVIAAPLLTVYWPKMFGVFGVIALTAGGIYFAVAGQSAFTEITSAVLIVGAFLLAVTIAVYRSLTDVRQE